MSRDVEEDKNYYRIKTERPIPLRWSAPETIVGKKYSIASDVYAWGVLVYEVFSFADLPFASVTDDMQFIRFLVGAQTAAGELVVRGSSDTPEQAPAVCTPLLEHLESGLRAHNVPGVPALVATLLERCVQRVAADRPSFQQVAELTCRVETPVGSSAMPAAASETKVHLDTMQPDATGRLRAGSSC